MEWSSLTSVFHLETNIVGGHEKGLTGIKAGNGICYCFPDENCYCEKDDIKGESEDYLTRGFFMSAVLKAPVLL